MFQNLHQGHLNFWLVDCVDYLSSSILLLALLCCMQQLKIMMICFAGFKKVFINAIFPVYFCKNIHQSSDKNNDLLMNISVRKQKFQSIWLSALALAFSSDHLQFQKKRSYGIFIYKIEFAIVSLMILFNMPRMLNTTIKQQARLIRNIEINAR